MLIEPNFDEVAEEISPGTYNVRIVGATPGEYKTGTKYVNWRMETFGEDDAKNNGRNIFHKTIIEGKGAFQVQQFWKSATGETLAGSFDTEQVIGSELRVTVDMGTDRDGNPTRFPEVKSVARLS